MQSILNKTGMLIASLLVASGACATPAQAKHHDEAVSGQVGGEYFVGTYQGLPGFQEHVHHLTATDWNQLAYLDATCRGDLKLQVPSGFSEVFHTTLFGALGSGPGFAAGYAASGLGPVGNGGIMGGVIGAGAGLFGGIDNRRRANRYDIGQCMYFSVSLAQRYDHQLGGVFIMMNAHAVNGHKVERPDASVANADPADPPASAADQAAEPPAHP